MKRILVHTLFLVLCTIIVFFPNAYSVNLDIRTIDFPGAYTIYLNGINNDGNMVGSYSINYELWCDDPDYPNWCADYGVGHGFIYKQGLFINLHFPPDFSAHYFKHVFPTAINDSNIITIDYESIPTAGPNSFVILCFRIS